MDYPEERYDSNEPDRLSSSGNYNDVIGESDEDDTEDGDEAWNGCRFPRQGAKPLHSPVFTSYKVSAQSAAS